MSVSRLFSSEFGIHGQRPTRSMNDLGGSHGDTVLGALPMQLCRCKPDEHGCDEGKNVPSIN